MEHSKFKSTQPSPRADGTLGRPLGVRTRENKTFIYCCTDPNAYLLDVSGDGLDGPVGRPVAVGLPHHDGDGDGAVRVVERLAHVPVEDRVEAHHLQLGGEEGLVDRVLGPRLAPRRTPVEVQLLELVPVV